MMQAGQADIWASADLQYQADLITKGFVRQTVQGMGISQVIFPGNKDPNSKWQNKKLREALEYALDKASIAKALGYGFGEPMTGVAAKGNWGYIEQEMRPYNVAKAKALLSEAGYPNGLKVTMLCISL
jgi:peptide/nickel transport system substrate-binding protein